MEVLRAYYAPEGTEHEFHDEDPDENLYSDKNLLKRESMRFHPQIVQLLKKMWTIADADGSGGIDLDEYTEVFCALYNAMHVESPRSGQSEDHTEDSRFDKDKIKERKERKERKEKKERKERKNKSAASKQRTGNYNSTEGREKSKESKQNKGTKEETEDTEGEATKKELLTEEEVKALAAEEFARDAFGKDELDKKTFMQCYFQLADTWTEKVRLVVCPQVHTIPPTPQPTTDKPVSCIFAQVDATEYAAVLSTILATLDDLTDRQRQEQVRLRLEEAEQAPEEEEEVEQAAVEKSEDFVAPQAAVVVSTGNVSMHRLRALMGTPDENEDEWYKNVGYENCGYGVGPAEDEDARKEKEERERRAYEQERQRLTKKERVRVAVASKMTFGKGTRKNVITHQKAKGRPHHQLHQPHQQDSDVQYQHQANRSRKDHGFQQYQQHQSHYQQQLEQQQRLLQQQEHLKQKQLRQWQEEHSKQTNKALSQGETSLAQRVKNREQRKSQKRVSAKKAARQPDKQDRVRLRGDQKQKKVEKGANETKRNEGRELGRDRAHSFGEFDPTGWGQKDAVQQVHSPPRRRRAEQNTDTDTGPGPGTRSSSTVGGVDRAGGSSGTTTTCCRGGASGGCGDFYNSSKSSAAIARTEARAYANASSTSPADRYGMPSSLSAPSNLVPSSSSAAALSLSLPISRSHPPIQHTSQNGHSSRARAEKRGKGLCMGVGVLVGVSGSTGGGGGGGSAIVKIRQDARRAVEVAGEW
jgi:hypothetical protein